MSAQSTMCVSFLEPEGSGAKVFFNLAYSLPTLAFLVFLTMRLKSALRRLSRSQSQIMRTYYSFLWVVCALSLFRCIFQIAESTSGSTERDFKSWSFVWLILTAGMTIMEVSVVTFLSQGYIATGKEALLRTLGISGAFALLDSIVKMILVFGCGTSLFIVRRGSGAEGDGDDGAWLWNDMSWVKWGFWTAHHLLYCAVYAFILVLPHTNFRDYLPARPSFYRYVALLCANNFGLVVGSLMIGSKHVSGYCVYGVFAYVYGVCYPPLLYVTFLSEFFVDDDLELEHSYYSEMRDAGYFDDIT
ncbi:putative membrane protein [Chloropicon roscoffensis]|uniref:Membrane protein n=1 Tax=Chloropicon roscoffensis TaxID=1461544 RepID=A0AAX4P2F4_9CHLO